MIFLFLIETVCCDPSSNCLVEMVQLKGHSMCFYVELTKNIPDYDQIFCLI